MGDGVAGTAVRDAAFIRACHSKCKRMHAESGGTLSRPGPEELPGKAQFKRWDRGVDAHEVSWAAARGSVCNGLLFCFVRWSVNT